MNNPAAKFFVVASLSLVGMSYATPSSAMERDHHVDHEGQSHSMVKGAASQALRQAQARISEDQARSAALAHVAGVVREVELEHQHGGVLIYSVEIKTKEGRNVEAQIDAATGAFLGTEDEHEGDKVEDGNGDDD